MRAPIVSQQGQDATVEAFTQNVQALTDVWQSMLLLASSNPTFVAIRREIARWARNTNQEFMDTFGKATASEEVRVILLGLMTSVPKQLGDNGRVLLTRLGSEAAALAAEAEAVAAAV